ncbi:unnamed protein product [Porites lobata]|uniref:Chitin-binding type-2 domain-containing protein n=1 Tax=Porites lobata TaxID=104759 RepID=A0ABN8R7U6_9CNID|nr:unnamed protein product [Porites lobata]
MASTLWFTLILVFTAVGLEAVFSTGPFPAAGIYLPSPTGTSHPRSSESLPITSSPSKPEGATGSSTGSPTAAGISQASSAGTLQPSANETTTTLPEPTTATPTTPVGDKNFCKRKLTGLYTDPKDCGSYYQCFAGRTFWKHCPKGLHFNSKLKVCDFPAFAKCAVGI